MMTIFRQKTKDYENKKLIGTHVPINKAHHFALYSLCSGESRAKMLRKIFFSFLDDIPPVETLINDVARKSCTDWVTNKEKQTMQEYKRQLHVDLANNKLPEYIINQILIAFEKRTTNETEK